MSKTICTSEKSSLPKKESIAFIHFLGLSVNIYSFFSTTFFQVLLSKRGPLHISYGKTLDFTPSCLKESSAAYSSCNQRADQPSFGWIFCHERNDDLTSKNFPTDPWSIPQTANQQFMVRHSFHLGVKGDVMGMSGVCDPGVCWGSLRLLVEKYQTALGWWPFPTSGKLVNIKPTDVKPPPGMLGFSGSTPPGTQ